MIIPSIDLMDGKAVQLERGKSKKFEYTDVLGRAGELAKFGELAVIDLDAAMGKGTNKELAKKILRAHPARVGGGIRSVIAAKEWARAGAEKIIVGTAAFSQGKANADFVGELAKAVGKERIIVSLDISGGKIAVEGWKKTLESSLADAVKSLDPFVAGYLVTAVDKEGMMGGGDIELFKTVRSLTGKLVTAAGGIANADEIQRISRLECDIQLGMAITSGAMTAAEAFIASIDFDKGLIPTLVFDTQGRLLMQANSTRESLAATFASGQATYYSRSRGSLWRKGETSGNTQAFVSVRTDCDGDSIALTVDPAGPACHLGAYSCFGPVRFDLGELYDVAKDRFDKPRPGSYTSSLSLRDIKRKVNEEAYELVEAQTEDEVVWEAADLLYFTTVYLAKRGIPLTAVMNELKGRRKS